MVRAHNLAPSIRVKRVEAIRRFVVLVRNAPNVGQGRTPHSSSSVFPTGVCPITTTFASVLSKFMQRKNGMLPEGEQGSM